MNRDIFNNLVLEEQVNYFNNIRNIFDLEKTFISLVKSRIKAKKTCYFIPSNL